MPQIHTIITRRVTMKFYGTHIQSLVSQLKLGRNVRNARHLFYFNYK